MAGGAFRYEGASIPFAPGDSLLLALSRSGIHPTGGGCLCFEGDCPHCLVTVDGVAYTRACQVGAADGLVVEPHPTDGEPPLPTAGRSPSTPIEYRHVDVVVAGGGDSGRSAAAAAEGDVLVFDAGDGYEVVGLYPGPVVLVRGPTGMVHVECREVIVATGAAEIQPVCPGSELVGIVTVGAARRLRDAGIDMGRSVGVGAVPADLVDEAVDGELMRFEGTGTVEAVVTAVEGIERRHAADTVVIGLGVNPRDSLARMANGLPVSIVGDAALPATVPPCPAAGTVCPCSGVEVGDLDSVWQRGFTEMELIKRATLAGTGTCQGSVCVPYLRSFIADRGGELQPAFTARPVTRQLTLGEAAAGHYDRALPRTSLHDTHLAAGARMDRIGGWLRPWTYGDLRAEYDAVRSRVSLGDVSTLGKMRVTGPDAEAFLQFVYPTDISTIRPGRSRYVLMLDERGYVFDDGLVAREQDGTFSLTFTSGGSSHAEMWLRDWGSPYDVRLFNRTMAHGAINVTGPLASELLSRAGAGGLPPYMGHADVEVAGVPAKIYRLSFTGEVSFELHHPADRATDLWDRLMDLGADLGVAPHGLEALELLRLEKGHILVGLDTDYDSTPRRLDHEWAVNLGKGDFIGRDALLRTNRLPLDRLLVGLESDHLPPDGASLYVDGRYVGFVTSAGWSWALDRAVMLAQLYFVDGELPTEVEVDGAVARRVALPFYDPEGRRARA